ncbi:MFS transporter [Streptomyces amakusaensis]|uniref:MFS transporter n=1 Tax=Streptomyces amakusaensis TaxID=67271 RepID=A0ABW0A8Z7_9ACTN
MSDVPKAGRREWAGLAVLALPTMLLSMDISVLYLALPSLGADLGAGSTQQLWIMDIYGFLLAGFLVTMGTLGDRIGRRKLLLIGAAAFGIASVAAAYSTSPEMLIVTRALLGVAGATLMPSTLALISNMFADAGQRGAAIAVWAMCMMAGGALGPVVGGVLLEQFWWGSVFLMGVPIMLLLLVTGPVLLPEFRDEDAGGLDLVSVVLSLAAVLPVIYGFKELAAEGLGGGVLPWVAMAVGLVAGAVFLRRQGRIDNPILDVKLFRNRAFAAALGIMLFGGAALGGTFLLVSQYVQSVEGLSPAAAGWWLVPVGVSIAIGAMVSPAIAQKVRPGTTIAVGLALSVVGFIMLTQVDAGSGLGLLVPGIAVIYFGAGPAVALGVDLVVGSAPPEKAGSAASMSETSNHLGIAMGIAAFGSIGSAVYHSEVAVPESLGGEAAKAAEESVAGAVAAADGLSQGGAALLDSAREAFTSGMHMSAIVGGVLFGSLALLAAVALREAPPLGAAKKDEAESDAGGAPQSVPAAARD